MELQKELSLSEWNTIEWNTLLLSGNGRTFAGANCSQSASATRWLPESPTDERIASGILTNQLTNPVDLSQSVFQSTLPVGGATIPGNSVVHKTTISIHAPRGGSDLLSFSPVSMSCNFNPRSPWGERRILPPDRRPPCYFNPRSPWGERLLDDANFAVLGNISIHAPRGGSDHREGPGGAGQTISIHAPRGGSDGMVDVVIRAVKISIHAPRGGSDNLPTTIFRGGINFNPRSPWGERPSTKKGIKSPALFQSTLPVGGATQQYRTFSEQFQFQSTLPVGGATGSTILTSKVITFQSTLPVEGAT